MLCSYLSLDALSISTHFLASAISGFFGTVFSSPADAVKTRYMN